MTPSRPDDAAQKGKPQEQAPAAKKRGLLLSSPALIVLLLVSIAISVAVIIYGYRHETVKPEKDTWRFIVSGDSRNCGNIVVPTIVAHSTARYQPAFYWHLGDLRAIYKIDEDMAAEAQKKGEYLSCKSYLPDAWPDFIKHQIAPFGTTRFYIGIGNHEVIAPKSREEFSRQFEDWLMTPRRQMEGVNKDDSQRIEKSRNPACQRVAKMQLVLPLTYYHWRQNGVEFIYLDNSSGSFYFEPQPGTEDHSQEDWFDCILDLAANEPTIKSVVVGMHEVLPNSRANNHSICDHPADPKEASSSGCRSGKHVYDALAQLKIKKLVYVLASHSHFYLDNVFPSGSGLPGWIVGTAGAVRYPLPSGVDPGPGAKKDVYGYLVGTVKNGEITFAFQEVKERDIPSDVRKRYPSGFPAWCFSHNSQNVDPLSQETTNRCTEVLPTATPTTASSKAKSKK
jgi:hypothetical protein